MRPWSPRDGDHGCLSSSIAALALERGARRRGGLRRCDLRGSAISHGVDASRATARLSATEPAPSIARHALHVADVAMSPCAAIVNALHARRPMRGSHAEVRG